MNKRGDITAAILAGGKSSRMGKDKALLELDGKPFIRHIADVLTRVFKQVFVFSDHGDRYSFLGLPIYEDVFKNCGPLGGIHAALKSAPTEKIFVVSCDVPFLNQQVVRQLLDTDSLADVTVVSTNLRAEPLCGIYDARVLLTLEGHLRRGQFSVTRFLESVKTVCVSPTTSSDETAHALLNINTPAEYAMLERTPRRFRHAEPKHCPKDPFGEPAFSEGIPLERTTNSYLDLIPFHDLSYGDFVDQDFR